MNLNRYLALLIFLGAVLLIGQHIVSLGDRNGSSHIPETEPTLPVVFVNNPGNLPDWAQPPSSNQNTRNDPPPTAASGPILPGPPSMPLPGTIFLALAGGTLACRRLYGKNFTAKKKSEPFCTIPDHSTLTDEITWSNDSPVRREYFAPTDQPFIIHDSSFNEPIRFSCPCVLHVGAA